GGGGGGGRRAEHGAVRHVGPRHVGAEVLLGVDGRRDILARDRLADGVILLRVLRLGFAWGIERVAVFLVPVELDVEVAPTDQLLVGDLLLRVGLGVDDAPAHRELVRRQVKLLCRHLDQDAPRFGGGDAHLLAAQLDAGRAGGAALVHRGGGYAHDLLYGL